MSLTSQPLYRREVRLHHPLNVRLYKAPEPIWAGWRRNKSLAPAGIRIPGSTGPQPSHDTDLAIQAPQKAWSVKITSLQRILGKSRVSGEVYITVSPPSLSPPQSDNEYDALPYYTKIHWLPYQNVLNTSCDFICHIIIRSAMK